MSDLLTTATPLSPALDLIFTRWTPHIVWLLDRDGPLRFGDLRRRLAPLDPAMLAERLCEMEAVGLVERNFHLRCSPRVEYALTGLGDSVVPVLRAVETWSAAHLRPGTLTEDVKK
ncbi:winged helix-turn-helix transcriptional regulator [Micromonospora sp. NPDC050397]|uniref:winged helix-turn-helix transcriptional regulator n=1 Tax=Micromonospora sp. NPDC050397 TaxID=3364279 RepID=UPI00384B4DBE